MYPHAGGDYVYLREAYHPARRLPRRLADVLRDLRRHRGDAGGRLRRRRSRRFVPLGAGGEARRWRSAITLATSAINYVGVRAGARVQQRDRGAQDRRRSLGLRGRRGPLLGGGEPRHLAPLVGRRDERAARRPSAWRCRRCCSAISAGTPRVRRERDPRPGAQHPALAVPRPRHLHGGLPGGERRVPLRAADRRAARHRRASARPRRGRSSAPSAARSRRRSCSRRSSAA